MKTAISYLLSLLQRLGIKHNPVILKRSNIREANSCNTLQVNRKAAVRPEPVNIVPEKEEIKGEYRKTFLQQPRTAGCRQSTLNLDEKNHSAIKKVLKTADELSMAGFVNNVLSHHFREYGEEISGIMRSYMSDLYKEEDL